MTFRAIIFVLFSLSLFGGQLLVCGGNVFFYMPVVSKSIRITFMPVATEMAKRGHEVVVLTQHPDKNPNPNITEITVDGKLFNAVAERISQEMMKEGAATNPPLMEFVETQLAIQDEALSHPDLKSLLKNKKKFDLVVVGIFGSEAGYYLATKFNAPVVLYSTGQVSIPWLDYAMGQPHNPSYMPLPLLEYSSEMNFIERLKNFVVTAFFHNMRNYYMVGKVESLLDKHFPGEERESLLEMERNAAAALGFTHPLFLDGWRPTSPNYVHLGMMNCRKAKPIENESKLRKFLDEAGPEGVIYVSFGSVLKASVMSENKRKTLLNVFGKLKQKVLWKWETESMEDKPENVMLHKWLPQQDVLGHPNVKLFVSHGGQSSFQETICHQKPAVFIPVQGDQHGNAKEAQRLGIGITIPFQEISETNLLEAIELVIDQPKYANKVAELGAIAVDQLEHPLERATWWLEHIMKYPQQYIKKSPVHKLAWYQYFCIDVISTIVAGLSMIVFIMYKVIKICCVSKKQKNKRE